MKIRSVIVHPNGKGRVKMIPARGESSGDPLQIG